MVIITYIIILVVMKMNFLSQYKKNIKAKGSDNFFYWYIYIFFIVITFSCKTSKYLRFTYKISNYKRLRKILLRNPTRPKLLRLPIRLRNFTKLYIRNIAKLLCLPVRLRNFTFVITTPTRKITKL